MVIVMCFFIVVGFIIVMFLKGMWRNIVFVMNGMGNLFGYVVGFVLGGVFILSVGW